ncbi:MAG: EamA family transporter [Clostridia bacterium]|nr:EamA family transporter [Clostridia bacterium]
MEMYFIFALIALLCWSGSDFFSKKGTDEKDKNSHWKVTFAVGLIMGIHFLITLIGGAIIDANGGPDSVDKFVSSLFYTDFQLINFVQYLPVAALYILAMVIGYVGLRYIELSISSPICNCSGSLALLLCVVIFSFTDSPIELDAFSIVAVCLITLGIIGIGIVDSKENEELKVLRRQESNRKYTKSFLALLLPIAYLIIDALGTVGDEILFSFRTCNVCNGLFFASETCHHCGLTYPEGVLEEQGYLMSDYAANSAFELTFLLLAIFAFIWVKFVKKDKLFARPSRALYIGGACETVGQIFYMAVMFSDFVAGMPMISAYCVLSVVWSRIFLKEKLSWKHYAAIAVTFVGIILLGIFSPV